MAVTQCDYSNKMTDIVKKRGREGMTNSLRLYANAWAIYDDYTRLNDTKIVMSEAYWSNTPMMSFINNTVDKYPEIYSRIVSPSKWETAYAKEMQAALNVYLSNNIDSNITYINAVQWKWKAWQWNIKTDWTELSEQEQEFIRDLATALDSFVWTFKRWENQNLATLIEWCIQNWVIWQTIDTDDSKARRSWLGWLIWLYSSTWSGKNNVLWLLWLYDWNKKRKYNITMPDWTTKQFAIADLYNADDNVMQEMFWALFATSEAWANNPIIQSPNLYRQAIKQLMKATDKDERKSAVMNAFNKFLKYSAFAKMTSYFLNIASSVAIWASCFTTWLLNVMSYNKRTSKDKVRDALVRFWFKKDHFQIRTDDPVSWIKDHVWAYFYNKFWVASYEKGSKNSDFKDISRENTSWIDNEKISFLLTWPMNILWDTIWKWEYQNIAMDMALQKLWWTWSLDSYLYMQDENWMMVPDEAAATLLLTTFLEKMADLTWFTSIDWWWQLNLWVNVFANNPKLENSLLASTTTAVLKMWHWMTTWWTTYVNRTYRILAWWAVNALTTQEQKDNAYNGIWGNWLINRYTRSMEYGWVSMPWEHAQALVSKDEFFREIMRFGAWVRNLYRLGNLACRDDATWELDWWCAWKHFLSVVYLPAQAAEVAHPTIRAIYNMAKDCFTAHNYFEDKDLWVSDWDIFAESMLTNFVKPFFRALYPLKLTSQFIDKQYLDELNEDWFVKNLIDVIMDSSEWILYYTADELSSYVYSNWAYWPKSYLNNDTTIFWSPLELRDTMNKIWDIKHIESIANDWIATRLLNMFATTRMIKWALSDDKSTSMYDSWRADKLLRDWNWDDDIISMQHWKFTEDMLNDPDFLQYVWNNLTSDWQSYWANFKEWVRDNKYNKNEIDYFETLLKKDMDEARIANPWLSDLQIYDTALRTFFEWTPTYDLIKKAIQQYDDAWESEMWAYTDYLASAARLEETTWVKWLALLAEYRKRQYMDKLWVQYSSRQTAQEKELLWAIENQVAWELWEYLWLADRRQYSNLMWAWFVTKHPEYKNYDPFKNLLEDDWTIKKTADLKTSWTLWAALWANNLAKTEMIIWNTNWYELANVFTEKFWSAIEKNWNEYIFNPTKAAQIIDQTLLLRQALEDSWKSPADISLILAPHLTKNLELWNYTLSSDSAEAKKFREDMWVEAIDNIRWLLYDTYTDINWLPDLLDELNDETTIRTILWKNVKWYKWWGGSLYYWKNTKKNYDYYSKPANAFNSWWSKNLPSLSNSYGKTGKSNYAWNYSSREFYFLNQRSYRNNVNSTRIAPDIPLSIWGFSKTTVKSKNPVSWFTTNIKPWEKRSTAKLGKSKNIVWWEWSRWPVSSFKA